MTWAGVVAAWITAFVVCAWSYRRGRRQGFQEGFEAAMRGIQAIAAVGSTLRAMRALGFRVVDEDDLEDG